MRRCWTFVALLSLTATAAAQPPPAPAIPTTALTLTPRAEPVPALRYHVFPPTHELQPGSAPATYLRAFAPELQGSWLRDVKKAQTLQKWEETPPAEWPLGEVQAFVTEHRHLYRELDIAARKRTCDWDLEPRIDPEGIALLLPEVQHFRWFARILSLRARLAVLRGNYDEALTAIQTGMGMAKHVGEGPTIIQALVGMAIAGVMSKSVEELVQRPDAPNLYWALSELPRPFVDLRRPYSGETRIINSFVADLRDLERRALTAEEAKALYRRVIVNIQEKMGLTGGLGGPLPPAGLPDIALAAAVGIQYPDAKRHLVETGWDAGKVEAMPVAQVVMLSSSLRFRQVMDDQFKWTALPYHEGRKGAERAFFSMREQMRRGSTDLALQLVGMLIPAIDKFVIAGARTDRKFAALRAVEAIRLHAAATGKLPATLAEVTAVPVPADPMTGAAFGYTLEGETATLSALVPVGERDANYTPFRFTIALRK